jgi:plastocyanin
MRLADRRLGSVRGVAWCLALAMLAGAPPLSAAQLNGQVRDANGNPLADAVVFVQAAPAGLTLPAEPRTAVLDQVDKQFIPHVLPVMVGTAVSFPNHDQIHHHVYSFSKAKTFEIPLYKSEPTDPLVFDQLGAVSVGCNIHEWMHAVILVLPTPWFAVTDATGAFALRDVPAGRLAIAAWHEGVKGPIDATVQTVDVAAQNAPLAFELAVVPRRGQLGGGGMRGDE